MNNFLQLLLEGDSTSLDTDISVDEKIEKELEESTLPIGLLIESVYTDNTIAINTAMETYQMACIVGGVTIVSEGTDCDRQEKATEVLTESVGDFFKKIVERLKKIRDWFIGIIKKIMAKFKGTSKSIDDQYKKCKANFDKNFEDGKFSFTGIILDFDKGELDYKRFIDDFDELIDEISEFDANNIKKWNEDPSEIEMFVRRINKKASALEDEKAINDTKSQFLDGYGSERESSTIKVTSKDAGVMKDVIEAVSKENKGEAEKVLAKFNRNLKAMISNLEKLTGDESLTPEIASAVQKLISFINNLTSLSATIINTRMNILGQAASAYIGFMQKVASGKAVAESMDFSFLFEGEELEDDTSSKDDTITQTEEEPIAESFIDFAYGFLN